MTAAKEVKLSLTFTNQRTEGGVLCFCKFQFKDFHFHCSCGFAAFRSRISLEVAENTISVVKLMVHIRPTVISTHPFLEGNL